MDAIDWTNTTRQLVDVAMGRQPADLVLRRGTWVCVQSGELIADTDIAIKGARIAYVGPDAAHTIGPQTQIIEAGGRYLVPGLLDGHMHVESGMLSVGEFVRAVLPHGTTGMFVDPHEIANVLGLEGVRMMVDEAAFQPCHVWVQMPSCVPSAPGLETPKATISADEVAEAMRWEGIIGLGEMMNFPGVIASDEQMHAEMGETRRAGKTIGGHYASPDLGLPFHGYVAGGAEDDHEGTQLEDALARARQGMKPMLRFGSAWHDVAGQIGAVTEMGLDPRHFILVTDDSHAETLVNEGHMNRVLRHAVDGGLDPMLAIQMMTLNTAEHFGVAREVGQIAPGRYADVVIASDLTDFHAEIVIARGRIAAEGGELKIDIPAYDYPQSARQSIHLARPLIADDFRLKTELDGRVIANVIGVIENQAPTRHLRIEMQARGGEVRSDLSRDLAKVALVERHHASGEVRVGLVQGFGLNQACAFASTVAHDAHHMLVVGTSDRDMAAAANALAEVGGGQCVVRQGQAEALIELPIAGLMSNRPAVEVAAGAQKVIAAFADCGATINNANMQLSLLALVVIPELRITDRGLVDVTKFEFLPVIEPAGS